MWLDILWSQSQKGHKNRSLASHSTRGTHYLTVHAASLRAVVSCFIHPKVSLLSGPVNDESCTALSFQHRARLHSTIPCHKQSLTVHVAGLYQGPSQSCRELVVSGSVCPQVRLSSGPVNDEGSAALTFKQLATLRSTNCFPVTGNT